MQIFIYYRDFLNMSWCSNTTPTITIFVPLLFNKAVSMLKHINGDSQVEHWVYKSWSNPPYLACFIKCLKKPRRFLIALFGTAHLGMRRVVTPWGSVVGDAHHWRDQPFYAIHKQLQWQFLESLCEDKFVIQLGALHIKDNSYGNAVILHSMTTTLRSHGMHIDYHNFLCF